MSEVIQALKDSIKHWENLRDGKTPNIGPNHCALCLLFNHGGCLECPIYHKTKRTTCYRTPYYKYVANSTPENAQKEIDFLKDILIEELKRPSAVKATKEPDPSRPPSAFHVGDIITRGDKGMGIVKGFTRKDRDGCVGVEFFDWDHGHDITLGIQPCRAKDGHGWWCIDDELTLVYRPA